MNKLPFLIALLLFLMFSSPAEAHVLQTDGSIGAVMHVDPDDNPVAGQPSTFIFELKDKHNVVSSATCTCTFSLLNNGTLVYSQPLFPGDSAQPVTNAAVIYTISQLGVYQVQVSGKPLIAGSFSPFTLTYVIRVDREVRNPSGEKELLNPGWLSQYWGYVVGIGILIVALLIVYKKIKLPEKKNIIQ